MLPERTEQENYYTQALAKIITDYLKGANKPSFNHFVKWNTSKIEDNSVQHGFKNAIELQRHWTKEYNNAIIKLRPGKPLVGKIKQASDKFKRMHDIVESKIKAKHLLRLAKLSNISQRRVVKMISEVDEDPQTGAEEEEIEEDTISELESDLKRTILTNVQALTLNDSVLETEFVKLANFSCINLLNHPFSELYQKVIPADVFSDIKKQCIENRIKFNNNCSSKFKQLVNDIFDEISKFQSDEDVFGLMQYLDEERSKTKDKLCDKYTILSIITTIVQSFKIYNNENMFLEATYLRKFEEILDKLLFSCSSLTYVEGEGVCQSTRRMEILTESESEYGRRIDLLIKSTNLEEQYDICSNEFKKSNVTTEIKLHQHSKNMCINARIVAKDFKSVIC